MLNYDNFISEQELILSLSILNENSTHFIKLIVSNDNDDSYIPSFDFDYCVVDCSKNWDLRNWEKFFDMDKPVIFINTTEMFNKIKEDTYAKIHDKKKLKNEFGYDLTGAGIWASNFYYNYRDKLWSEGKSKFIIILKDSDVFEMWQSVNAGFTIELCPLYFYKSKEDINNKSQYVKKNDNINI